MFQSFDETADKASTPRRIARLRAALAEAGLDGYVVPRADAFQGEYVHPSSERLRWLTGFTGSAGVAIVLADRAAIFVDGRYTVQVRDQVVLDLFTPEHLIETPPARWLRGVLAPGQVVGFDPWLVTAADAARLAAACLEAGARLQPVAGNLVDRIWDDRPPPPSGPISLQPLQFAGEPAAAKLAAVAAGLAERKAAAAVLTQTDAVAWALNIRGHDIPHTPAVLAFAIVHGAGPAELFIEPERVPEDVAASLAATAVLRPPHDFAAALAALGAAGAAVELDFGWAPEAIRLALAEAGAKVVDAPSPCTLPRARKNRAELEGARAAHLRDGAAVTRFLRWLDREAPSGGLDEIDAARRLEAFRRDTGELKDISFDSISGAGPHAAIPHYRVTSASALPLRRDAVYLIDSGGQYQDGTTDVTRTVIVGTPTAEMKDRFTRVLKGMINLSRIRFPAGTTGGHLDMLARQALWMAGLDFDHGTGHGVGSYLSVHEGPQRFSKADRTVLETGMILSNEPGYYKPGEYGIRIENLVVVREPEPIPGGERPMHWLETLTFAPIDRNLIEPALLAPEEHDWLDAYHARVLREIGPRLDDDERTWLAAACAPL